MFLTLKNMGGCATKNSTKTTPVTRINKNRPSTIVNSESNTVDLNSIAYKDMYEHLKQEALKNEEIQKAKREAALKQANKHQYFIKTSINESEKKKTRQHIETHNLLTLHEYVQTMKIAPHEELSDAGYYWTSIHYACNNKDKEILEYLCRLTYEHFPQDYEKIMNSQTFEGYTPLIIICQEGELDLAEVFLRFGGIDIDIQDKKNLTASSHAISNKKKEIAELLASKKDFKKINKEALSELNADKYFEKWKSSMLEVRETSISSWIDKPSDEETLKGMSSAKEGSDLLKIVKECMKSKQSFSDSTFPHDLKDLVSKKSSQAYARAALARWLRPHQIFGISYDQIKLFEKIDASSIKIGEGGLHTLHFLSVIAGLAEFPHRLKKIFQQSESNKYGVYALNLYLNGKPKEVIVDDYFPCEHDKLEPLFAKPMGKEIWVLILEKAWSKMFGSYLVNEIEVLHEAMEDIFPAPALGYWMKTLEIDAVMLRLKVWNADNFLVSATSWPEASALEGLLPNHTYTVLGVYQDEEHKVARLVKLRNTMGILEWKGQYQDGSTVWTEELKAATGYAIQAEDGIFYMTLEEFYHKFAYLSVCCYSDNWVYQYHEKTTVKSSYYRIKIEKQQRISIRVHQENKKLYNVTMTQYEYSPVELILFTENGIMASGGDGKYLGAKSININNDGFIHLTEGECYLRVKVHYRFLKSQCCVVSTYSPEPIIFEPAKYDVGKQKFFNALKTMARSFPNPITYQTQQCEFRFNWIDHIGVIYLKNQMTSGWNVTIEIEKDVNLKIGKKGRSGKKELKTVVQPYMDDILIVKKVELHKGAPFTKKIYESQH